MAEVKKIATRESYGNTLKELAAEGHDDLVVLDADLAAATKTGMFRKAYPDRHFDCGIAEGNMMGVAAGLSTMGYVPFVSSFAMFAAGRAFEQVRNSIGYPHLNVKIGATHGGISVGEDGASHQCCEDFALMRSLPGMTIICPADDVEARAAVRAAYEMQGPVYLRFGRLAVPVFHDEANYHFEIGKGEQITEGNDIAIIATGLMVNEARIAAEQLAAEGIPVNMTLCFTVPQAILAARSGARYISPFVGRFDDISEDGIPQLVNVVEAMANYDFGHECEVIAASIRSANHVTQAALMGADIATVPFGVLKKCIEHPLTERGLVSFLNDWEKVANA